MSKPITVRKVIELYLTSQDARVAAGEYSADAHKTATAELRRFAERYGDQTIAECKQHDVSEWLAANPSWKSPNTLRRVISGISACFNWALEEELIERSPYRRPRALRGKPNPVRRPATLEEYVRLMCGGSRPLRRALFMLRRTGMRTCEMRNLTWDEVHLDGPSPHLLIADHKTVRQTGKPRMIGLDTSTARFLRNLGKQYERRCGCSCETCRANISPNVFTNCRGEPWDRHTFARHLRRCATAIGLDEGVAQRISGYCLRHLFTVNAIEAGISTRQIADQLGHSKTTTIDTIYGSHTRHRAEHLSNVAEDINRKRNRQGKPGAS